ncbi:MAG: CpaF family protein [Myxococcales bacterium]|nr:CpaF family protein [Myxococcales bacterium]
MARQDIPIPREVYQQSLRALLGPITPLLDDPSISEILVNGPQQIYIERSGKLEDSGQQFDDPSDLMSAAQGIAQFVGRTISSEYPRLDARLPDGSRVHIILPPAARDGIHIAIRKFSQSKLTIEQLITWGSITEEAVEFLRATVSHKKNIIVAGGTGSGKTSLLNVLSTLITPDERIIVIEDSSELQLQQPHVVYLEAHPGDLKGKGKITIKELFWSSMRLRPDRMIIGELRGGEALDLIQAMTSGHGGSMSTTHATYPDDTLRRIETMALMSDVLIPHAVLREQVASAIQIVIQTSRFNDGSRGITHISEVQGLEGTKYILKHCFLMENQHSAEPHERKLVATGYTPDL